MTIDTNKVAFLAITAERYLRDDWLDKEEEIELYNKERERAQEQIYQDELIRKHEEELEEQRRLDEEEAERVRLEQKLQDDIQYEFSQTG